MRAGQLPALSVLAFASGCCALVYQIGWLRELRLVFGASTYASAAVLAAFMGGLGIGSAMLGGRADRSRRPLLLYARLELGIAATALASPPLFALVRTIYLGTGGSLALGQPLALVVRLLLSTLVLGLPTFLMGGTLPALASSASSPDDVRRRRVAFLYGLNTLGAVSGALVATFVLLESLGTRLTVVSAGVANVAVAAAAFALSSRRRGGAATELSGAGSAAVAAAGRGPDAIGEDPPPPTMPAAGAAALTGFVFFFMEIVWYRMLAPVLGGTTYTHGLIVATALFGIGVGGVLFSAAGRRLRPTVGLFAATCGFEAVGLALAFALGDRIALLAVHLRTAAAGLPSIVGGWVLICAIVVFPAALVAGFQFPLLIALLGRGGDRLGKHVGTVYAWNSAGSILGSLAGGFGMLPLLGALACWRLAVVMLMALCAAALAIVVRRSGWAWAGAATAVLPAVAALLIAAPGPSAAWRHSPIGFAGKMLSDESPNAKRAWLNFQRGILLWERDGIESSVALQDADALAMVVNGKVDGNARGDAGTQIMGPLIGALLHPRPRTALVIGLGTGSSAGWLAAIESVERVDVAELEPSVTEVARQCAPVNHDALADPKVRILSGDGRELLMTSRERYDLIFSEPSNPYRAGVAALYTREFYETVAARLAPGGLFSQWLQGYGVDSDTVRSVAATLASVFGDVETWKTNAGDLLFVCSGDRKDYDLTRLAARLAAEPFRSAMLAAWGVTGVEGYLSGFLAEDAFARHVLAGTPARAALNTDDRSPVEFAFIRAGASEVFPFGDFRRETRARIAHRPAVHGGEVDWGVVDRLALLSGAWRGGWEDGPTGALPDQVHRSFWSGSLEEVLRAWSEGGWEPQFPLEAAMLAEALADGGDERARSFLPHFSGLWPAAASVVEARLLVRQANPEGAYAALLRGVAGFRQGPWDPQPVVRRALSLSLELAERHRSLAPAVFDLLAKPFSVRNLEMERAVTLVNVAMLIDCRYGERALARLEPHVLWDEPLLRYRSECYAATGNPRAAVARRELDTFLAQSSAR